MARTNGSLKRTPRSIPPDQDQRDREEVRAHDLIPVWFVLEGEKLYRARAGLGDAVVQERAPEPDDSD